MNAAPIACRQLNRRLMRVDVAYIISHMRLIEAAR